MYHVMINSVVCTSLSVREVWSLITGPVKLVQCCQWLGTAVTFLRSCVAQALSRVHGPRQSLRALA